MEEDVVSRFAGSEVNSIINSMEDRKETLRDMPEFMYQGETEDKKSIPLIEHSYIISDEYFSDFEIIRDQINVTSIQRDKNFADAKDVLEEFEHRHEHINTEKVVKTGNTITTMLKSTEEQGKDREEVSARMKSYYLTAVEGKKIVNKKLEEKSTSRLGKTRRSRMETSVKKLQSARKHLEIAGSFENSDVEKRFEEMAKVYDRLHSSDRYFAEAVANSKEEEVSIKNRADLIYYNNLAMLCGRERAALEQKILEKYKRVAKTLNNDVIRRDLEKQKKIFKEIVEKEAKSSLLFNSLVSILQKKTDANGQLLEMPTEKRIEDEQKEAWESARKNLEKKENEILGIVVNTGNKAEAVPEQAVAVPEQAAQVQEVPKEEGEIQSEDLLLSQRASVFLGDDKIEGNT